MADSRIPDSVAPDSRPHAAPLQTPGMSLPVPSVATPVARLASKDFGVTAPLREGYDKHLFASIFGWAAFAEPSGPEALTVMGALSDRTGRRPLLLVFTVVTLLTAYPAMLWLVHAPSFGRLLTVELWLSCLFGSYNGAMVVFLTEIMPTNVRTSGFSLAYSLATAIFGGFTPAISTYLIHLTGNRAIPGLWLSFAAGCGFLAALLAEPQATAVQAA